MDTSNLCIDYLCRTCMIKLEAFPSEGSIKQQYRCIFETIAECDDLRITDLLSSTIPQMLEGQLNDELPNRMCCKCWYQLLGAYRFQQMCMQSDQKMRELATRKRDGSNMLIMKAGIKDEVLPTETEFNPPSEMPVLYLREARLEGRQMAVGLDIVQSGTAENLEKSEQLLESCETSQDDFNEFIYSKPTGNPNTEIAGGDPMHSSISVENCENAQGELSEFIKNEPIDDDEENTEYSDDGTIHSTTFVQDEELKIEEDQITWHFAQLSSVRDHMRTHTGETPYKCKYCGRAFVQASVLIRHLQRHLGDNTYRCKLCPLAFPLASERRLHLTTHKYEDPETRERNMTALREEKAKLMQHILKKKPKVFKTTLNLRLHMRTHTGERPYTCKYCTKSFAQLGGLNCHLRKHLGENIHRCELCPLAFPLASELRLHLTTHKNEDPETSQRNMEALEEEEAKLKQQASKTKFRTSKEISDPCNICKKRFNTNWVLRRHMRVHTCEKTI